MRRVENVKVTHVQTLFAECVINASIVYFNCIF